MALQRVEIKNPVGVNTSMDSADLPLNAWSSVNNVSFKNGKSQKAAGYEPIFGATPGDITYLTPLIERNQLFWFEATPSAIWKTEGTTQINVSRRDANGNIAPYIGTLERGWTGGNLNTVVVMNNGIDVPQAKLYSETNFRNLPYWPDSIRCKIMRVYKNYLFAMNLTRNGNEEPTTVKWSSPADPGQVPYTWDANDFTNDAGENFLADTGGAIVDASKLRDSFIIYKEDSVYSVNYIGGTYVFQFRKLFDDIGALSTNCMAEFDGKHFVVGQGDVYVHNGVTKQSVITGAMREYLYSSISPNSFQYTQVVADYGSTEMWVCFCSPDNQDSKSCDRAIVWNWAENTWSIRDLPQIRYITSGIVDPQQPDYWDVAQGDWETDALTWGEGSYNPSKKKLVMSSCVTDKVYMVGTTTLFDGKSFNSYLERSNMYFDDDRRIKFVSSVTPHVNGRGQMRIFVGSQYIQDGPVTWRGPFLYNIGQDYKIDCRVSGRYIAIRFEADSQSDWRLNGYTLEAAPTSGAR